MARPFLCLAVLMAVIALSPAIAQTTGSIRGQVVDTNDNPLPGVTVRVTGELIRGERSSVTGSGGTFLFRALPAGRCSVSAAREGFESQRLDDLYVGISATTTVHFILPLATVTETLEVTATAPIVALTSSSFSTHYPAEFIEDLPTNRTFQDFMSVAPGISQAEEGAVSFSAFGSSVSSNAWHIDGLDVTATDTGNAWWYINPDAVAEVQVMGVGLAAEYGNLMGAAINVLTKSGTNRFEGAIKWYEQFDELTDSNVEREDREGSVYGFERDVFRQITAVLGGPIRRDRGWFFGAYENYDDAITEPGVDPQFARPYQWERYDLKLSFSLNPKNTLELKGHYEDYDWNFAGNPFTAPSALAREYGTNPAWGLRWQSVLSSETVLEVHYAGWEGEDLWRSQTGSTAPPFVDFTQPVPVSTGGVASRRS